MIIEVDIHSKIKVDSRILKRWFGKLVRHTCHNVIPLYFHPEINQTKVVLSLHTSCDTWYLLVHSTSNMIFLSRRHYIYDTNPKQCTIIYYFVWRSLKITNISIKFDPLQQIGSHPTGKTKNGTNSSRSARALRLTCQGCWSENSWVFVGIFRDPSVTEEKIRLDIFSVQKPGGLPYEIPWVILVVVKNDGILRLIT